MEPQTPTNSEHSWEDLWQVLDKELANKDEEVAVRQQRQEQDDGLDGPVGGTTRTEGVGLPQAQNDL